MRTSLSRLLSVGTIFKMAFTVLFVSAFTCSFAQDHNHTFKEVWQFYNALYKLKDLDKELKQVDEYYEKIFATIEKDSSFLNSVMESINIDTTANDTSSDVPYIITLKYGDNKAFSNCFNDDNEVDEISCLAEINDLCNAILTNGDIEKTVDSVAVSVFLVNRGDTYKLDYELIQRDSLEITNRGFRKIEEPILKD